MKKNRKEVLIAVFLLLLTLCSGFLIQAYLMLKEARRLDREANAVMTAALDAVRSSAAEVRAEQAAVKEPLQDLPERKRAHLDDLQLDLLLIVCSISIVCYQRSAVSDRDSVSASPEIWPAGP